MRKHSFIAASIALVCTLLAGTALVQSDSQPLPPQYIVEKGRVSGGRYHLTCISWYVSGTVSGENYRLLSLSNLTLDGNGCCCTYLPCILRNH